MKRNGRQNVSVTPGSTEAIIMDYVIAVDKFNPALFRTERMDKVSRNQAAASQTSC